MESGTFFSHGKLLLTAEYVVLDGALALAVPTKAGQNLTFQEVDDQKSTISWNAFFGEQLWLKAFINYQTWEIIDTNLEEEAQFLVRLLQDIQSKSPLRIQSDISYHIRTQLEFPRNYGWGSSSTLINNLSVWAGIDAFELNEKFFKGSGYDIAVAQSASTILYQRQPERKFQTIDFKPEFASDLVLIHLKQKKNSREAISQYRNRPKSDLLISEISEITKQVIKSTDLTSFCELLSHHEELLSDFLQISTIKEKLFPEYGGMIKSLGGWEGDFILASKFGDYKSYFEERNYDVLLDYNDVIY